MKKVRLDSKEYSSSSKRSVGFEYLGDYYQDKKYRCKKCYKQDVFTAEEQKKSYEIKKNYMWQERFLCNSCYLEMCAIKKELLGLDQNYLENRDAVLSDKDLLSKWLDLLQEYPKFLQKEDSSKVAFVRKALAKL